MRQNTKKIIGAANLLVVLLLMLAPTSYVYARTGVIGKQCNSDRDCKWADGTSTGLNCETAGNNSAQAGKKYCDCNELDPSVYNVKISVNKSESCEREFGKTTDGGTWKCVDGAYATYDLDYCVSTRGQTEFPIEPPDRNASDIKKIVDMIFDVDAAGKITASDITKDINDRLQITIPGLNFSTLSSETDSKGYLRIPWIGEYLAAVYKYAMVAASILAVVMIIIEGTKIILSAGGEMKMSGYKRIGQIAIGLVILWGSYAIMYNINPELVNFKALKVKYIVGESIDQISTPSEHNQIDTTAVNCQNNKPQAPSIYRTGDKKFFGEFDCLIKMERKLTDIQGITIHEGGSSPDNTIGAWKYAAKKLGYPVLAHYIIDRDGKIFQIAGEEKVLWHGEKASKTSIGIDLVIPSGCSQNPSDKNFKTCANYTDAQYSALKSLTQEITTRTSVKYDDQHVFGHCNVKGASHADPRGFKWEKIGLKTEAHFTSSNYPQNGSCLPIYPL